MLTEHVAGLEHGFLGMTQGLTQSWFLHASFDEQSSSSSHPAKGSGSTNMIIILILNDLYYLKYYQILAILAYCFILTVFITGNIPSSYVTCVTCTNHCPQWKGILDLAYSILSTWFDSSTRILTFFVYASLPRGAFSVSFATWIFDWN